MKATLSIACVAVALGAFGCENASGTPKSDSRTHPQDTPAPVVDQTPGGVDPNADNTKTNERDRNTMAPTPMDQSNAKGDIEITAEIRKTVVADNTLGTDAHNVKIITNGGSVVLRGPVASDAERAKIVTYAKNQTGVAHVDDQLEVTGKN